MTDGASDPIASWLGSDPDAALNAAGEVAEEVIGGHLGVFPDPNIHELAYYLLRQRGAAVTARQLADGAVGGAVCQRYRIHGGGLRRVRDLAHKTRGAVTSAPVPAIFYTRDPDRELPMITVALIALGVVAWYAVSVVVALGLARLIRNNRT